MRIIAMMNQKGGVGKTTTAVNLGAALGELGRRVCLMDLDPQAHLTINYGLEPTADTVSLYHVLCDDRSFLEAVHKVSDHVALVPSSIDLAAAEVELVSVIGREQVLKRKLEQTTHDFDYFILDCPPSLGLLTINALAVATEVIIPMQPHFLPLQGVAKLLETIQLVRERMNPGLRVSGVVLTMFDAQTKLSAEVVHELQTFFDQARGQNLPWSEARIFDTRIRRNIKLAESPSFGQTILQYEPSSNGAADYRALARELVMMEAPMQTPVTAPADSAATAATATGQPVNRSADRDAQPPANSPAIPPADPSEAAATGAVPPAASEPPASDPPPASDADPSPVAGVPAADSVPTTTPVPTAGVGRAVRPAGDDSSESEAVA